MPGRRWQRLQRGSAGLTSGSEPPGSIQRRDDEFWLVVFDGVEMADCIKFQHAESITSEGSFIQHAAWAHPVLDEHDS